MNILNWIVDCVDNFVDKYVDKYVNRIMNLKVCGENAENTGESGMMGIKLNNR